ncbi:MAG: NUDIX hydrolase [Verrucomicrobiae bacterium]|nr:NUDIX hydrolase [Verrucomicrobiae bacterium]
MTLAEIENFLRGLGAPKEQIGDMARQLDKRARQMVDEQQKSYEESLAYLISLMKQGWAAQSKSEDAGTGELGAIRKWEIVSSDPPLDMRIFKAQWKTAVSPRTDQKHKVLVLSGSNWVNVIALTPDEKVVLIEQYRHGIDQVTLEIPGGMINRDEAPELGGARELREETGYVGDDVTLLGTVHPNPAFQSNICHTILIRNAHKTSETEFDSGEDIAVHLVPLKEIPDMIREGKITHSLVILAFYWLELKR